MRNRRRRHGRGDTALARRANNAGLIACPNGSDPHTLLLGASKHRLGDSRHPVMPLIASRGGSPQLLLAGGKDQVLAVVETLAIGVDEAASVHQ
jgi:hypothetical protein